jgi:hypothetical protein
VADNKEEQNPSSASSPKSHEEELRELVLKMSRDSRRSAILGFLGGAVVVAGLGATVYSAMQSKTSLQTQIGKTQSLQAEVSTQNAEVSTAKQQAVAAKSVLRTTVENLQAQSPAISASAASALDQAFDADPSAAKLFVRVYIHIHAPEQRKRAAEIAHALRGAGYFVPGIDVKSENIKESQVHYYTDDSQSLSDTDAIMKIVAGTGIAVEKLQVPPAKTDHLRPRAYSLWLSPDVR